MKKRRLVMTVLLLALLVCGCGKPRDNESSGAQEISREALSEEAHSVEGSLAEERMEEVAAEKLLAITVDDGPDGAGCEEYLKICRENDIAITFFVIGQNIEKNKEQLQEMLDAGCEIGNHSWSHGYLTNMTAEKIQKELGDTDEAIRSYAPDARISFVRAPYFAYNDLVYEQVGYPLIDAALAEGDSDQSAKTLQTLLGAGDGDIVLLHCWNQGSIQALREAVPKLKEQGFRFVTVSELFEEKGVEPTPGTVYRHVAENLKGRYQKSEQIFSGGEMTSGDWNHWADAAVLELSKVKGMTKGQALWVEYESTSSPCLILQSWSGGAGWVQAIPTSDDGKTAIFTYEDLLEQFGAKDLSKLNACSLRPFGADLQVVSVDIAVQE